MPKILTQYCPNMEANDNAIVARPCHNKRGVFMFYDFVKPVKSVPDVFEVWFV